MAEIGFAPDDFRPMIKLIVQEVLAIMLGKKLLIDGKLALSEADAAKLLGLNPWQLAHERKVKKIGHVRTVGRRILYTYEQIKNYLDENTERGN